MKIKWCIALLLIAEVVLATAQTTTGAVVRGCDKEDWQVASSQEGKRLTRHALQSFGMGFISCESVLIPFLSQARVLRFQTSMHVDYSYTATLMQAKSSKVWRSVSSGRGMVRQIKINDPNYIDDLNWLLQGGPGTLDEYIVRTASLLYCFMVGLDNKTPFGAPALTVERPLGEYSPKPKVSMKSTSSVVDLRDVGWQMSFGLRDERVQLLAVTQRSN